MANTSYPTVIGIKTSSFKSEKDGSTISGFKLFYTYEGRDVDGLACANIWVRKDIVEQSGVGPGDVVDFRFNRYGKVADIVVI